LDSIAVLRELGIEGSEIERLLGAGLVRAHEARKKV
jgi:hypothetical protein